MNGIERYEPTSHNRSFTKKRQSYAPDTRNLNNAIRNNLLGKAQFANTQQTMGDFAGNTTKNTFNTITSLHLRDGDRQRIGSGSFAATMNQFNFNKYRQTGDQNNLQKNSSLIQLIDNVGTKIPSAQKTGYPGSPA